MLLICTLLHALRQKDRFWYAEAVTALTDATENIASAVKAVKEEAAKAE